MSYGDLSKNRGAQVIGGAIFNGILDTSHPIGYGFDDTKVSIFRNSTLFMEKSKNPYSNPLVYSSNPLASGYISDKNQEKLSNTAA